MIVEDDNETNPVSLDDVAKDLEGEGFTVDKIFKDNETRIIKVKMDSMEESTETRPIETAEDQASNDDVQVMSESNPKLLKVRRRRSTHLTSLANRGHGGYGGHSGGFYGGGYGGGHGGHGGFGGGRNGKFHFA